MPASHSSPHTMHSTRADRLLGILALGLLAAGCIWVLLPFLSALLWAAILASISWPGFKWIDTSLGGRRVLAATCMTLIVTLVLLVPVVAVTMGLADNMTELGQATAGLLKEGLPDAPTWLSSVPIIGSGLHDYWQQFVHDGQRLVSELEKLAEPARNFALLTGRGLARGVVDIAMSVFLAFFFFLYGEGLADRLRIAVGRLAGVRAQHLLEIARGTVTGVVYGILGTALAQGILATIGFAIAGVPASMLLGVATFALSPVPIGPPLIWAGAAFWLFQQGDTGWAIFVAAWGFFIVSTVDNVIKPLIISRGSSLPFAIVFLGVLGGVLAFGVIGLFIGPTLLALGYRLTIEWTTATTPPVVPTTNVETAPDEAAPPPSQT